MQTRTLHRFLYQHVLPSLPDWSIAGKALWRKDTPELALLIHFDDSAYTRDEWSHVRAVLFPLYTTFPYLSLTLARELRGINRRLLPETEDSVAAHLLEAIKTEAWPFLQKVSTLDRLCENLVDQMREEESKYVDITSDYAPHSDVYEALAGAELLRSNTDQAIRYTDLLRDLNAADDREFAQEEARHWTRFGQLIRSDSEQAKAELLRSIETNVKRHGFG